MWIFDLFLMWNFAEGGVLDFLRAKLEMLPTKDWWTSKYKLKFINPRICSSEKKKIGKCVSEVQILYIYPNSRIL